MILTKVELGKHLAVRLNLLLLSEDLPGAQTLPVVELAHGVGEHLLHGVEVVPPQVPVDWAWLYGAVVDYLSLLWLIPPRVDSFPAILLVKI